MAYSRLPLKDPRTVARDIPGIFDVLFPQLTVGMIAYLNREAIFYNDLEAVSDELVNASALNHAMLFEVAYARAEQILHGGAQTNWNECLNVAVQRQQLHFDAKIPEDLSNIDKIVADQVGNNLAHILSRIQKENMAYNLVTSPEIPGYQWIASGKGDFSVGTKLNEGKCTNKNFSSADYRQILMYWLLSYASKIENDQPEWENCLLLNPRHNNMVEISFNEIIKVASAGKSKIEILELFSTIVGDYALKVLSDFKL